MADGSSKPIEKVKKDDTVLTRNLASGKNETKKVESTFVRSAPELVTVRFAQAHDKTKTIVLTLQGTPEHPMFTTARKLVKLGDLGIGSEIVTRAGPSLVVVSTKREHRHGGYTVYNFRVADDHNYFVGTAEGGAWVHNAACGLLQADENGQLSLFKPEEPFNRMEHYGRTPTTLQKGSVPDGMLFDHDPPLVQHYYEGDGQGGIPGYMMTPEDRMAYGKSLDAGTAASSDQRFSQGGSMKAYSMMMRNGWFGY
jgi:hypothetical protein